MSNQQLAVQVPFGEMQRMAEAFVKSALFGVKTVDQAIALMVVAQAEGKHPGTIASEYHIIQGKASLKADAMLARFQQAGGKVEWHDHTNEKVSATFSHPQSGSLRIDWDLARAKAADLGGKDNWKKYPRQMLRARVISEGVRATFPAVLQGMYTPEEVQDFSTVPTKIESSKPPVIEEVKATVIEAEIVEDADGWPEGFEEKLGKHEAIVNAFLLSKGQIAAEQTWRDLPEGSYRDRVISSPDKFLSAARKFAEEVA
jgi:hypothetical protein